MTLLAPIDKSVSLTFVSSSTTNDIASIYHAIISGDKRVLSAWDAARSPRIAKAKRRLATQTALVAGMPLHKWQVLWDRSTADMMIVSVIPEGRVETRSERQARIDPVIPIPLCPLPDTYRDAIQHILLLCLEWRSGNNYQYQLRWQKQLIAAIAIASESIHLDLDKISLNGKNAAIEALAYLVAIPQEVV